MKGLESETGGDIVWWRAGKTYPQFQGSVGLLEGVGEEWVNGKG